MAGPARGEGGALKRTRSWVRGQAAGSGWGELRWAGAWGRAREAGAAPRGEGSRVANGGLVVGPAAGRQWGGFVGKQLTPWVEVVTGWG